MQNESCNTQNCPGIYLSYPFPEGEIKSFLFYSIMHLLTIPIHFSETTVTLDTGYFLHECIKLVDIFGGKKENVNIFEMIIFFVI